MKRGFWSRIEDAVDGVTEQEMRRLKREIDEQLFRRTGYRPGGITGPPVAAPGPNVIDAEYRVISKGDA